MDIIKLPYTSYLDLSVKDFSEFIQNELLKENAPKDSWYDDISDNIYYYLERYFIKTVIFKHLNNYYIHHKAHLIHYPS